MNRQKGETMAIEWSALKVSEAMGMVEEFVNQADEPLEQAKIVATEARKMANLPRCLDQCLFRLIGDIERIEHVKGAIKSVRNSLPDEASAAEPVSRMASRQPSSVNMPTSPGALMPAGRPRYYPKQITKGGDKGEDCELV